MRKRILSLFTFLMLFFCFVVSASAASVVNTDEYIEYFSDGSYATTTIEESLALTRGTVFLKSGNKVYTYWDAKGNEQFKVTLYGEFNVNPIKTCRHWNAGRMVPFTACPLSQHPNRPDWQCHFLRKQ